VAPAPRAIFPRMIPMSSPRSRGWRFHESLGHKNPLQRGQVFRLRPLALTWILLSMRLSCLRRWYYNKIDRKCTGLNPGERQRLSAGTSPVVPVAVIVVTRSVATMLTSLPAAPPHRVGDYPQSNCSNGSAGRINRLAAVSIGIVACRAAHTHRSNESHGNQFH
jgi:hypothetical protein